MLPLHHVRCEICTRRKLRYYGRYTLANSGVPDSVEEQPSASSVPLYGVTRVTKHDGEVDFYRYDSWSPTKATMSLRLHTTACAAMHLSSVARCTS